MISCGDTSFSSEEKINFGRKYKEYLRVYKEKDCEIKKRMMQRAKETIEGLRKWRETNGYVYQDQDSDFFLDECNEI